MRCSICFGSGINPRTHRICTHIGCMTPEPSEPVEERSDIIATPHQLTEVEKAVLNVSVDLPTKSKLQSILSSLQYAGILYPISIGMHHAKVELKIAFPDERYLDREMMEFLRTVDGNKYAVDLREAIRADHITYRLCLLRALVAALADGSKKTGSSQQQDVLPADRKHIAKLLRFSPSVTWEQAVVEMEKMTRSCHIEARILSRIGYMALRTGWGGKAQWHELHE